MSFLKDFECLNMHLDRVEYSLIEHPDLPCIFIIPLPETEITECKLVYISIYDYTFVFILG